MTAPANAADLARSQLAAAAERVKAAESELALAHKGEMLLLGLADGRISFAEYREAKHNPDVRVVFGPHSRHLVREDEDENLFDFWSGQPFGD